MTREQIREGLRKHIEATWYIYDHDIVWDEITGEALEYLDSQGVAIKVEKELPLQCIINETVTMQGGKVNIPNEVLQSAGYTAWEPLIEVHLEDSL